MILKFLIIAAVIYVVYIMFFKTKTIITKTKKEERKKTEVNDMVACEVCGIYTEIEEAILSNGKYYCSHECLSKAK